MREPQSEPEPEPEPGWSSLRWPAVQLGLPVAGQTWSEGEPAGSRRPLRRAYFVGFAVEPATCVVGGLAGTLTLVASPRGEGRG